MPLDYRLIDLLDASGADSRGILRNKTVPETEEVVSDSVDSLLTRLFCNRCLFLDYAEI